MMRLMGMGCESALSSHKVCINRALSRYGEYGTAGLCVYLLIFITYFDRVLAAG